jgi:cytoskeleton protein RodZ
MAGSLLGNERAVIEFGLALKTQTSPRVVASASFDCDVCGAQLDEAHLEPGRAGSQCTFCGAPQRRPAEVEHAGGSLDVGDALHEARLDRGETLEQAAHLTRIQPSYLRALEHDDPAMFEPFPGMTYARYFLRDYAQHLGLDPAPLVRRFDREVREPVVTPVTRRVLRRAPQPRRWAFGAVAVLVALLVASGVWAQGRALLDRQAPAPPPWHATRNFATGPIGARGGIDLTKPIVERLIVVVRTTGASSWVSATIDGTVVQETMPAGDVQRFRADRAAILRLGNPSAVSVTVNGRPVEVPTDAGPADLAFVIRNASLIQR